MPKTAEDILHKYGVSADLSGNAFDGDNDRNTAKQYGIPGMRWGRRKQPDGSYKETGRKAKNRERAKEAKSMSDSDLQAAVKRLQMERQYRELTKTNLSPGKAFIQKTLTDAGKQAVSAYVNQAAQKGLQKGMDALIKQAAKQAKRR